MKKSIVIHPYLFAINPILFLYAYNLKIVTIDQFIIPSVIVLFVTLCLLYIAKWIFKDYSKVAIIISTFLVLFFSYGHILEFLKILDRSWDSVIIIGRIRYLLPVWILTLTAIIYFVKKTDKNLNNFNNVLNGVSVTLVGLSLIKIGIHEINKVDYPREKIDLKSVNTQPANFTSEEINSELPDIYYIVLDMYNSAEILKELYSYENKEFYQFLRENDFYIAENSKCNYPFTNTSLSSSLNMDYLDSLINISDENINFAMKTAELIENNKVMQILKSLGYTIVNIGSGSHLTNYNRYADLNIKPGTNDELIIEIVQSSMLLHVDGLFGEFKRHRILNTFEEIGKIPEIDKPTFTLAHINVPHGPYVFGKEGERVLFSKMFYENRRWKRGQVEREHYINQLIFTSKASIILVDSILKKSSVKPIIIIQGDHGSATFMPEDGFSESPTEIMLKERMGILNAIYLPHDGNNLLYDSMSPVNTFRVILNSRFSMNYDLLEDKHYYIHDWKSNKFIYVTDIIN